MPIDLESILAGSGSGFVATILTILGINRRLEKIENTKLDCSVHESHAKTVGDSLERIERRLDDLYQHFMNGGRK